VPRETTAISTTTPDGWRLSLEWSRPPAGRTAHGVVLLTHAMMASGRTLARLAAHLAAAGREVYVLDFRGHGASAPPTAREADWTFDDYVAFDLLAAQALVAHRSGLGPTEIDYLGHSLGGLVGVAAGSPFRRQVLVTTNLWRFRPGGGSWRRRATVRTWAGMARLLGYAPMRRLGMGSDDEPRGYVLQLSRWAFSGVWRSRDGTIDYGAQMAKVRTPTLALVASGDSLCTRSDASEFASQLGSSRVSVVEAGRARELALPFDPDHFGIVRDPRARPVWDAISEFLG